MKKYSENEQSEFVSDFGGIQKYPNISYNKIMTCRHVYEYIGSDICPNCGRYTHETNLELQHKLFIEYYKSDKPKEYLCPVEGGTIRGWWSI